mmetsp:Transcript_9079/g.14776  ORF Transcript_9079/g.14776 Transcript_9079/m.14776 type:complete len:130 (-) Transcript_9079:922-1311(-)
MPFGATIGLCMEYMSQGTAVMHIEGTEYHMNANGVAHGGVLYTLADTAMGAACMSLVSDGNTVMTNESSMRYFKVAKLGSRVVCTAKVIYKSKKIMTVEADILCDDQLIAKCTGSFVVAEDRTQTTSRL